jgi:hypothetical protein
MVLQALDDTRAFLQYHQRYIPLYTPEHLDNERRRLTIEIQPPPPPTTNTITPPQSQQLDHHDTDDYVDIDEEMTDYASGTWAAWSDLSPAHFCVTNKPICPSISVNTPDHAYHTTGNGRRCLICRETVRRMGRDEAGQPLPQGTKPLTLPPLLDPERDIPLVRRAGRWAPTRANGHAHWWVAGVPVCG